VRGHGPFRGRRAAPLAAAGRQAPALQLATPVLVALAALAGALVMALAPRAASAQIVNFRHYTTAEGMPQSQVLAVEQDRLGYMWFGTYGGLTRLDGGEYRTYTKADGLTSNAVYDIVEDEKGRLLIATSGGLCIRHAERFQCFRQSDGLVDDDARSVASDRAGGVWVGTARGLSHVSGGKIRNYTKADGLPSDRVRRIVVDGERRVWLATEKGLAHLEGDRFVHDSPDVIGDTAVQFITPMGDDLLVGVGRRLFVRSDSALTPVAAGMIPDSALVIDGAVDSDGTIWVATRDGALRIKNGQVEQLRRQNGLLSDLLIRVLIDREHDVWFGTESGASKHVPGPFRTYTDLEGLPNPFVRAIGADAQGRLWTGGRNGIAVREGERFRPIPLPRVPDNRI
jgi:ligand-binding sensor domain-containing protein